MADEELDQLAKIADLKKKRRGLKAALTRNRNYLKGVVKNDIDQKIIIELNCRLEKVEPLFEIFNSIQLEIDYLAPDSLEDEEIEHDDFERQYFDFIAEVKKIIIDNKKGFFFSGDKVLNSMPQSNITGNQQVDNETNKTVPSSSQAAVTDHSQVNNIIDNVITSSLESQSIKLPIIKLPVFKGEYEKWLEFRDAFKALVHSNNNLSEIQKYYYLKSSLEAEASEVIQNMEVSADNYVVAWNLLEERFENKKLIIHNHVKSIFDFPQLYKESHIELRKLFDNVTRHLRSLKTIGEPTEFWDTLLIHIIINKFDSTTRRDWESYDKIGENQISTMKDLNKFLKNKCELLEKLQINRIESNIGVSHIKSKFNKLSSHVITNEKECFFCKEPHYIYYCEKLLKLSIIDRIKKIKLLKLCSNCLRPFHTSQQCRSRGCRVCGRKHNSLLHLDQQSASVSKVLEENNRGNNRSINSLLTAGHTTDKILANQVLLSTAIVYCNDPTGNLHEVRCLLDNGSQSNFITEKMCKQLGLQLIKVDYAVKGVGKVLSTIKNKVQVKISSAVNKYTADISCLVIANITDDLPLMSFCIDYADIPNVKLADPCFNKKSSIDILLGSNIFWNLLCVGQIHLGNNKPILQKTLLGWIVAGNMNTYVNTFQSVNCLSTKGSKITTEGLSDNALVKFWHLEECSNSSRIMSSDERYCEDHFRNTYQKDSTGRFVVSIPFKKNVTLLGESRQKALDRFKSTEKRLSKNTNLKKEYYEVMAEYINMGHMSKIDDEKDDGRSYYLAHHAVIKATRLTTKVRVVFDASMKTDSGLSLNDVQYTGPSLQDDIFSILLRFRKYRYVMTGDISKMYRMILINKEQRRYQRIFWRSNSDKDIECYQLNTVTFGTASAPYLAVRCLLQLAYENKEHFKLASEVIERDFYMDDLLTGSDTVQQLLQIQKEVTCILASAGFNLRKWLTNKPELLNKFHVDQQLEVGILMLGEDQVNKTLGVFWNANLDVLQYSVGISGGQQLVTKRTILSVIAQIFDPLGLLGPIVIVAKLIMQHLWQAGIGWDEAVPQDIYTRWIKFQEELPLINKFRIPRHVLPVEASISIELHGFSDASEQSYGAAIYVRCQDSDGSYTTTLLCAKSRVAPVKKITLPRLELCGALLLAHLFKKVKASIILQFHKIYFWCDSTITLAWIKSSSGKWKTFVANRVSEIQDLTDIQDWHYVCSKENPADLLTRGIEAKGMLNNKLWWKGPDWLSNDDFKCKFISDINLTNIPEQRIVVHTTINVNQNQELFTRFSSLHKLKRVVAYCLRFIQNCKVKCENRQVDELTVVELTNSTNKLVKIAQMQSFPRDYEYLMKYKNVKNNSNLLQLAPFIDHDNLIRVGGRINHSLFQFSRKHPLILSSKHPLTRLIFESEHLRLLHCGPNQLLSSVRERYWPVAGRNLARNIVRKCVICFKVKPVNQEYIMGNLPFTRVNQYTPFTHTGVDYAGPYLIKDRKTRPIKLVKCYVCIFVCMTTKACHIEIVSDLCSESFISMFKRFIARRGRPSDMYSDNSTVFTGANNRIRDLQQFLLSKFNGIIQFLAKDNIQWHFIPPKTPNFGGLWEAGIKSVKHHLKRVIGNNYLNYEEFITVLVQVESILNSRPLCPLSSDPSDLTPLTPAHFLIGKSLTAIPEVNLLNEADSRLNKYKKLQQIIQHFWKRWHKEYISQLQIRVKWKSNALSLLKVGALVLVKEDNIPPLKWPLGRIIELHPGQDGVVRVVSIQLANGVVKRGATKLCVLPCED